MRNSILGIDIGTSAVKAICKDNKGQTVKASMKYDRLSPCGIYDAFIKILKEFNLPDVSAIGLTSQIGTYIINGEEIIFWYGSEGKEELQEIKSQFSKEQFVEKIQMNHPDIISFPMPRLLYIYRHYKNIESIMMPKEYIINKLTGNNVTDTCSWRGIIDNNNDSYCRELLDYTGITESMLPSVSSHFNSAGHVTAKASMETGLSEQVRIFIGCNDFYSALLGMGMIKEGSIFDLTGTSEHAGVVRKTLDADTLLVSSPFMDKYVHYGVTASSGTSLKFAEENFNTRDISISECLGMNPPIFLPYLKGERAPIWDSDASGVFFGITENTNNNLMAYSVMEGVAFSILSILEMLPSSKKGYVTVSAGASDNNIMNSIKAEVFSKDIVLLEESQSSALGALMIASIGMGIHADIYEAVKEYCNIKKIVKTKGICSGNLMKRYHIYKDLYPLLKESFKKFRGINR